MVIAPANYADLLRVVRRTHQHAAKAGVVTEESTMTLHEIRRFCLNISGFVDAATDILDAKFGRAYIAVGRTEVRKRDEDSLPPSATSRHAETNR